MKRKNNPPEHPESAPDGKNHEAIKTRINFRGFNEKKMADFAKTRLPFFKKSIR